MPKDGYPKRHGLGCKNIKLISMKKDIQKFAVEAGNKIAQSVFTKSIKYPILLNREGLSKKKSFWAQVKFSFNEQRETKAMEKEVWEQSLDEAVNFFLDNRDLKFDEQIRSILLSSTFTYAIKSQSGLQKMSTEELLANEIKFQTNNHLFNGKVFIFENNV